MGFTPDADELELVINNLQDLEFDKEKFVDDVFNGEYILVIGNEVMMEKSVEETGDVNQYILKQLNCVLKTNYKDFNEVALHSNNKIDPIRNLLNLKQFKYHLNDISIELVSLLRLKLFKTVITTTFDFYLENLMLDIWGDKLKIVNICDDKSLSAFRNDLKKCREDIKYSEPTLIYAFGKAEKDESKMYAKTDTDYIKIIERWMQLDKRSDQMIGFIQSKRLLALGCKFEDWYFRFFWYILKRNIDKLNEGEVAITFDVNDRSESNLKNFLYRTRVYTHGDARRFMEDITKTLTSTDPDSPFREQIIRYRRKGGIFISYCSHDVMVASKLFFMLRKKFDNVWFDNISLYGGDNYNEEIEKAIASCKIFIPVLTSRVASDLKAGKTDSYYNKEWRLAAKMKDQLKIIPIAINGYNLKMDYHNVVFEGIIEDTVSGVDLMMPEGYNKLVDAIDKYLME